MTPGAQVIGRAAPAGALATKTGKPGKTKRSPFILVCFLLCLFASPATAETPSYTAIFVTDPMRPIPTQEFDCAQNVYAYFIWQGLKGMHQVTVLWINPKGQEQDDIDLKFIASTPRTENWVALKFLGLRKERNPLLLDSASSNLAGLWSAKIFLDGNSLEEKKFTIRCD